MEREAPHPTEINHRTSTAADAVAHFAGFAAGQAHTRICPTTPARASTILLNWDSAVKAGRVARETLDAYARGWRLAERMEGRP